MNNEMYTGEFEVVLAIIFLILLDPMLKELN
jgi:hypothetical protein